MNIKKLISCSIVGGSALLAMGSVSAANFSGEIVQISTNGAVITVWVKPSNFSAVPIFVYSATTDNLIIGASLGSSLNRNVSMTTSGACAGTGSVRPCGAVTLITIN